jgi:hypothetical protein
MSLAGEAACGFDAVNVTVTKLRFHKSATAVAGDPGWTEIPLQPARRIDIAKLHNGAIQALGSAGLSPGFYAQARLVLDPNNNGDTTNSVVVAGTTTEVPMRNLVAATEGIAVGPGFTVADGQSLSLIADFDACRSVVPSNGAEYLLRPVITALPTAKNGIVGFIAPSMRGSNVRVSAQQGGVVVRATFPDPATGEFNLSRLPAGSYDVVITADAYAASVIAAVPVASSVSTTPLSTAAVPITLQAGATGFINATLSLAPMSAVETPFGSATQTFAGGPKVTVSYRLADLQTGAVAFRKLPRAAPQLAVYNASSALGFSARNDVTPGVATYTVAASAPGYVTVQALPMMAAPD